MEAARLIKSHCIKLLVVASLLFILSVFFRSSLKVFFIVPLLIAMGAFSMFYHHFIKSPVNLEMIKLATVVSSIAYGIPVGLFVGLSSNILGHILAGKLDDTIITSMIGNAIIAVVSGIFSDLGVFSVGMLAVAANYIFIVPFIFIFGRNPGYAAVWVSTNIAFNVILFSRIAPFLVKLL